MLGLTGGYCAGKSEVAAILSSLGWTCVDVDAMGHRALEYSLPEVVKLLGPSARRPDGLPDRRAIGRLVFADKSLMGQFETLVHPVMFALTDEAIVAAGGELGGKVCLDAAILYRLPQASRCQTILEVRAPLLARLRRGMARDGLGLLRILQRILSQHNLKQSRTSYESRIITVNNAGDRQKLVHTIQTLAKQGFRTL
ncbi:MAG: dephospho-CoA kinase [Spirochaetia bacterium]|jgi:dephospho-CoA kinase|nr:dephospho-CoA kinase [Spirochaetia bacterium]